MNIEFKSEELREMYGEAKQKGFKCFANTGNLPKVDYFFFTDGENIGYVQTDYSLNTTVRTVHKPCKECGTGFRLEAPILEKAFITAPNWANKAQRKAVVKYANWNEYASRCTLTYTEI